MFYLSYLYSALIHPFSEDLNESRDVADDAFTGIHCSRVGLMMGRRSLGMCQFENGGFVQRDNNNTFSRHPCCTYTLDSHVSVYMG